MTGKTPPEPSMVIAEAPRQASDDPMDPFRPFFVAMSAVIVWVSVSTGIAFGLAGVGAYVGGILVIGVLGGIMISVYTITRTMGLWWLPAFVYALPPIVWLVVGTTASGATISSWASA